MSVKKRKLLECLLRLLYPPKCICCGKLLESQEQGVCKSCMEKLTVTDRSNCIQSGEWFRDCVSPFFLEGVIREGLNRYKFQRQEANGAYFGRWMGKCAREQLSGSFDVITWVPVSRRRCWERGFDQSKVLAQKVAEAYGTKACSTLKKRKNIAPLSQTKGGKEKRRGLVKGIYGPIASCHLAGKRILLVDDIITTGSTLEEASQVLCQEGAAEVCCVTAARNRLDS